MNTLKDLVNKVYSNLQQSEWIIEYPELSDKRLIADSLESIALINLENFIPTDKLNDFANESEKSYTELTFKKYIENYPDFLDKVESTFYSSLLLELVDYNG